MCNVPCRHFDVMCHVQVSDMTFSHNHCPGFHTGNLNCHKLMSCVMYRCQIRHIQPVMAQPFPCIMSNVKTFMSLCHMQSTALTCGHTHVYGHRPPLSTVRCLRSACIVKSKSGDIDSIDCHNLTLSYHSL